MAGEVQVNAPPKSFHVVLSVCIVLVGGWLTYDGLVSRSVRITQGPKGGPPTTIWQFYGTDAIRIGCGAAVLLAYGLAVLTDWALKGRSRWSWKARGTVGLGLLTTAVLLFFPPWEIRFPGITAGFYAFLIPALAGVYGGKAPAVFLGLALGVGLSVPAAWGTWMNGMMPGVMAFFFLGPHLAFLIHPGFRRLLTGAG